MALLRRWNAYWFRPAPFVNLAICRIVVVASQLFLLVFTGYNSNRFVQLAAFMSMNIERHLKAHRELYENLANGETVKAAQTKAFYDEYFAVLDLTAEFYLETVQLVFQEHALPLGALTYQNRRVEPRAIGRTGLFTVEGERDDICAVGQTLAAHDLCSSLRPYRKRHHMQAGVGHYGVFSGKTWEHQIYPLVKNVILQSD